MNESALQEDLTNVGKVLFKKLNLYTILQVAWLIELYYLGINSIYNLARKYNIIPERKIPSLALEYNKIILGYFNDWSYFIIFIAITISICGLSILFVRFIPKISEYNLLYWYSSYGVTLGGWLILIFFTYKLYLYTNISFMLTPILAFMLLEVCKFLLKIVKEKLNIDIF